MNGIPIKCYVTIWCQEGFHQNVTGWLQHVNELNLNAVRMSVHDFTINTI